MRRFTDASGREWELRLTLGKEAEVHREIGTYLSATNEADGVTTLLDRPADLGMALWVLCREQADARGVSLESFFDALYGTHVEDACEALVEATLDFLGRRGETMRAARVERLRLEEELQEENLEALKTLDGKTAYAILSRLLAARTDSVGSAAPSAASTPET